MMLNCVPIHLFNPETSFAPLKLVLRVKGGRRRSTGMSEAAVFRIIVIGALAFLLRLCEKHRQWKSALLCF